MFAADFAAKAGHVGVGFGGARRGGFWLSRMRQPVAMLAAARGHGDAKIIAFRASEPYTLIIADTDFFHGASMHRVSFHNSDT
ncbi:MAG: hypothetical protein AAF108_11960 [Planctomycetota bacterium]